MGACRLVEDPVKSSPVGPVSARPTRTETLMSVKLAGQPTCPKCSATIDGASSSERPREVITPKAGDLCVCAYCCSVLEFTEARGEVAYRLVPESEFAELDRELKDQLNILRTAFSHFGKAFQAGRA